MAGWLLRGRTWGASRPVSAFHPDLKTSPRIARRRGLANLPRFFLLLGLVLGCPWTAGAQTWNGSASDGWGTAANWTPNAVPNSSSASATVTNSTNNPVLVDVAVTIGNLTIGTGNVVSLDNSVSLTIAGGTGAGTIDNAGTLGLNGTVNQTDLILAGTSGSTVTLSGAGTLALSNSVNNRIYSTTGDALVNNSTLQGSGQLGINNPSDAFTLTNNGTIDATQTAGLSIAPTGNTTNNGTFQAESGSTLFMNGTLTNYNPGTSTLTGGTYNAFSGTLQLSQANAGGGAVIATNAATVLLDGTAAKIADAQGNDILTNSLGSNSGSFTIQNGANMTSAATGFSNSGTLVIGANSTFSVGGSQEYLQSGGTTTLTSGSSDLAVATGHGVDINGGSLRGFGTVHGNLVNAALVLPGLTGQAGVLTVNGNYIEAPTSTLSIQLGGPTAGTDFSQLSVLGTAALKGTLDVSLIRGFTPALHEQFVVVTSAGVSGTFTNNVIPDGEVTFDVVYQPATAPNEVVLDTTAIPEPTSCVLVAFGFAIVAARGRRARGPTLP